MIKRFLSWVLVLVFAGAWAQQVPSCPCFTVDKTDGCVPLKVTITDCSGDLAQRKTYNFHEIPSSTFSSLTSYTYTSVGVFNVTQAGNFQCGGPTALDSLTKPSYIKVRSDQQPSLQSYPCANQKLLVVANDPQYDQYYVQLEGSEKLIPKFQSQILSFTTTPPAQLSAQGEYASLCRGMVGNVQVQTYDVLKTPQISTITISSNSQIQLSFTAEKYHRYEMRMRTGFSGAFLPLDTIEGQTGSFTYTASNLNTLSTNYCFQIRAFDYCGQESLSGDYCSVILQGTVQNQQNQLQWTDYPTSTSNDYALLVNGSASNIFVNRSNKTSYLDTSVICGQNYCYQLKLQLSNGVSSFSNTLCLKAVSNAIPPTVQEVQSSVSNNHAIVSWQASLANPASYTVYFSSNSSSFSTQGSSTVPDYTDNRSDPSLSHLCYRIGYTDNCGNASASSTITCPVYLTGKVYSAISRDLSWQPYTGWTEGVKEYVLEKVSESGSPYFSISLGNVTSYLDSALDTAQQVILFRIKAVSNTDRTSYSNVWKAQQESKIYFPNAFTPNGDGLNDEFHAEGLFVTDFKLEIWNRNGEGMFSTNSMGDGWDGTVNGQKAPADTYMYKWEAKDKLGKAFRSFPGTVQLIR